MLQAEINNQTYDTLRAYVDRYRQFELDEGSQVWPKRAPRTVTPHGAASARQLSAIPEDNHHHGSTVAALRSEAAAAATAAAGAATDKGATEQKQQQPATGVQSSSSRPHVRFSGLSESDADSTASPDFANLAMLTATPRGTGRRSRRGAVLWPSGERVEWLLQEIADSALASGPRRKNTTILRRCAELVRCLHGARITACKSAKDRTAMSVTLEQARLLHEYHKLRQDDVERVTDLMRRHGTFSFTFLPVCSDPVVLLQRTCDVRARVCVVCVCVCVCVCPHPCRCPAPEHREEHWPSAIRLQHVATSNAAG